MTKTLVKVTAADLQTSTPVETALARAFGIPEHCIFVDSEAATFESHVTIDGTWPVVDVFLPIEASELIDVFDTLMRMCRTARSRVVIKPFSFTMSTLKEEDVELEKIRTHNRPRARKSTSKKKS